MGATMQLIVITSFFIITTLLPLHGALAQGKAPQIEMLPAVPATKAPEKPPIVAEPKTAAKAAPRAPEKKAAPALDAKRDLRLYRKSGHRSKEWNDLIAPAFDSFDSENYATAYVFLKRAYDRGCRDALVLFRYGLYLESKGNMKEAAQLLLESAEKMKEQYPGHPLVTQIHQHAGRAAFQVDDLEGALPHLQKALEVEPDDFMLLFMAGQILRKAKRPQEAYALFLKAKDLAPPESDDTNPKLALLGELMATAFELEDFKTVDAYADEILLMDPLNAAARAYKNILLKQRYKQREHDIIEKIVR